MRQPAALAAARPTACEQLRQRRDNSGRRRQRGDLQPLSTFWTADFGSALKVWRFKNGSAGWTLVANHFHASLTVGLAAICPESLFSAQLLQALTGVRTASSVLQVIVMPMHSSRQV